MSQRMLRAAEIIPPELQEERVPGTGNRSTKKRRKRQAKPARTERGSRPVQTFQHGSVETSVWLNPPANPLEAAEWRISQRRLIPTPGGPRYSRSLRRVDLDHARWGLYEARRWLKKTERKLRLRSFLLLR
jgi:hypothetical protein